MSPYIWMCVVELLPDPFMSSMGAVVECGVCGDVVDAVFLAIAVVLNLFLFGLFFLRWSIR